MQAEIDKARGVLSGVLAELNLIQVGAGHLLRESAEERAARFTAKLLEADCLLAAAQSAGRKAGAAIVQAVRAAGCSPAPAGPVCESLKDYPGPTAGSRINGQAFTAPAGQTVLSKPSPFFGLFTEAAVMMADAHAAGLGKEHM